ncbi:hypothetical protein JTB14_014537 [Gonioctena quinquepunctata]|nr:hypothetical protein JTB14_014537 [Gonioctena quinquepunctata]
MILGHIRRSPKESSSNKEACYSLLSTLYISLCLSCQERRKVGRIYSSAPACAALSASQKRALGHGCHFVYFKGNWKINMAGKEFAEFNPYFHDWCIYAEQLKQFYVANKKSEEALKFGHLLSIVGTS